MQLQIFLFVFVNILLVGANEDCTKKGSSQSATAKIKKQILCNYDTDYRPVKNQSHIINVKLRMVLKSLDVTDEKGTFRIHSWMGVIWKDEFLTWNPSDFESVSSIHISHTDIWVPDLKILKNRKNEENALGGLSDCIVQSTGIVSCVSDDQHSSDCTDNLDRWPFDTRTCTIRYSTGIYNNSQIRLLDKLITSVYFENPLWQLTNSSSKKYNARKSLSEEYSNYVKYQFQLKRYSTRTVVFIIVPAITLIIMTLLPLWMKPNNIERFCLVAVNVLSHFLFIEHLQFIVPISANALPRVVTFFRDSLGISVIVLVELTLIKTMLSHRKIEAPKWLLTPCKFVANAVINKTQLIEENPTTTTTTADVNVEENRNENKDQHIEQDKIMIATIVDRFLFILLSVIYFILAICLIPLK